jgi:hypothetical protein
VNEQQQSTNRKIRAISETMVEMARQVQALTKTLPTNFQTAREVGDNLYETVNDLRNDLMYDIQHADDCKCGSCKERGFA